MKSILMIGMGRFGSHLCMNLSNLNNEIMIVDECEEKLEDLLPYVTSAKIGNCTNVSVSGFPHPKNFYRPPKQSIYLLHHQICDIPL